MNHEQQDGQADLPPVPAAAQLTPKGASRRRIAGLGVSGVLMTVASNNAMAALVCKSPSGALSGNLNSQAPGSASCEGRSPGYWKNHSWPAEVNRNDMFTQYFPCSGELSTLTCKQVLTTQDDKYNVAMHIMATYLNVCSGKIGFLTRQAVKDMWSEYNLNRSYTPAVGATAWSGEELVAYLSSTQLQ